MANYQPTYLGEIELSEESLAHYGVKGMRWRRRKGNLKKTVSDKSNLKTKRIQERIYPKYGISDQNSEPLRYDFKRVNMDFQEHVSDKYSKHRTGNKHKANATSGGPTLGSIRKRRNTKV